MADTTINKSPLKLGARFLKDTYVEGAKSVGNTLGSVINSASNTLENIRNIRNPSLQSQSAQRITGGDGVAANTNGVQDASGTGANSQNQIQQGPVQLGGRLADELNSMQPVKEYSSVRKFEDGSTNSKFDIDPENYAVSNGSKGKFVYSKNSDGSISKINMSSGDRQILGGNVSFIGPNGTNIDGSPLSPKDQAAIDRSARMIQDWKDYKQEKMYRDMINNARSPSGRTINTNLVRIGQEGLADLATNKLGRYQVDSTTSTQRLAQDVEAAKADQQAQTQANAQALEMAKARMGYDTDTFKQVSEDTNKGMKTPFQQAYDLKSRNRLNRDTAKSIYAPLLGDIESPEDIDNLIKTNQMDPQSGLYFKQELFK